MKLKGINILITSNEPWGDVWFSKHNYAHELSKLNNVVFANPIKRWGNQNLKGPNVRLTKVQERLHVMDYANVIPAVNTFSIKQNNKLVSVAVRRKLAKCGLQPDLYLPFDPSRLFEPALLGAKHSVFIAVDKYGLSIPGERLMFPKMDGFITISELFNETYAPYGKPILTVSHAIAEEEFEAKAPANTFADHGLYIGTLDIRVDLDMVECMARRWPDVPFVFIGPYKLDGNPKADQLFLKGHYPNVHFLGPKPFKELASHIAAARFCIAPMDLAFPGNDISHHKVFLYLAQGKPVFCNEFLEYGPIRHLLYMCNDRTTALEQLGTFLANGEDKNCASQRIAFARTKTYSSNLARMENFLGQLQ